MCGRISISILCAFGVTASASDVEEIKAADPKAGWKLAHENKELTIYSRPHPDSRLKEFKAIGAIEATTRTVHAVIDDFVNYPSFMPYTAECKLVKRDTDSIV